MRVVPVVVCLVVLTGCTGPIAGPSGTESPTGSNATDTVSPASPFSCTPYEPVAGLSVYVSDESTASFTARDTGTDAVVLDETIVGAAEVEYHGDSGAFAPRTDYRVVVRVEGSVRWNRTIRRTELYRLTVEQNGSVTVEATIVEDTPTPCPT